MGDIQYAPVTPKVVPKSEPPEWLVSLLRAIGKVLEPIGRFLGSSWGVVEVLLLILAVIGVGWIAWTLLWPLWRDRRPATAVAAPGWAPEREAAIALLEDADRLAAEGRYGEAAHLLLQRSVHQIASARPDWLTPSSTAREIATIRELPWAAKRAFAVIAGEVERSLFALHGLTAQDWTRARTAYAEFALADLARADPPPPAAQAPEALPA